MTRVLSALCLLLGLGLVAPPAMAAPAGAPATIYVSMVSDLSPRLAGRSSDFTAVLGSGGTPVPNETLTLWLRPEGTADFVAAGQGLTDGSGRVTVWATLERNAVAHWTLEPSASYDAGPTPDFGVEIAPRVTARAHDRTLRRGQRLVVTGRTFPAKAGCPVALWKGQRRPLTVGPAPVRLARASVRPDGSYRLVRRFHKVATMHVSVTVSPCAGNGRGVSPAITIRVR
jgi:hypothetical protein